MIALSTAWLADDRLSIDKALDALEPLGLGAVEFNHKVHPLDLEFALRETRRRGIRVTSLHNICSAHASSKWSEDKHGDRIASLDEAARRDGVRRLMETAEAARALGARGVILHGGIVEAAADSPVYRRARKASLREGKADLLREHLPQLLEARNRTAPQHLEQLSKSLREVCPLFPEIRFGLEVRYDYFGLPDYDEMEDVLAEVNLDNVGYWHDCGHAQVFQNLGLWPHEAWLARYRDRLVGVHLHGMKNFLLDHQAPDPDNMDFEMVARYTRPDTLLVMEVSAENTLQDVLRGKHYLEKVFLNHRQR